VKKKRRKRKKKKEKKILKGLFSFVPPQFSLLILERKREKGFVGFKDKIILTYHTTYFISIIFSFFIHIFCHSSFILNNLKMYFISFFFFSKPNIIKQLRNRTQESKLNSSGIIQL